MVGTTNPPPGRFEERLPRGERSPADFEFVRPTGDPSDARTKSDWMALLKTLSNGAVYPTLATAQAARPVMAPDGIRLLGYAAAGDGGAANYKKVGTSAPSVTQGRFSLVTADGVTTWYQLDEQVPNELMFGAVATASNADQTAAINSLLAFCRNITPCRKAMIVASHTITDTIVVYSGLVVEFACPFPSTGAFLTKGFNGDMITLGDGAKLINCRLAGDGANFTGRGVVISGGTDQVLVDPLINGMAGYCLEFTADNAGSRFKCYGGVLTRQTVTDSAIGMPTSEASTNGRRMFWATQGGGGSLIDFRNGNYTMMTNCGAGGTNGFVFAADSQRVVMTGCRVAIPAWSIQGTEHTISQCEIAGTVTLLAGSTYCKLLGNTLASAGNIVDNSGQKTNYIDHDSVDWTIEWKGASGDPAIVNGTITGSYRRQGRVVTLSGRVNMGSSTTYGSGNWSFTLPNGWKAEKNAMGTCIAFDNGTNFRTGVAQITAGASAIECVSDAGTNKYRSTIPFTWASGDYLQFEIAIEISV